MKNKGKIYAKSIYYLITSEWMVRYAIKGVGINTSKTTIREKTHKWKEQTIVKRIGYRNRNCKRKIKRKFSYAIFSTPQI